MNNNIQDLLNEEIRQRIENLKGIPVNSDEYKVAVEGIAKLTDRAIELEKINLESEEREKNREFEQNNKFNEHNLKVDELNLKKKEFEQKCTQDILDTSLKNDQLRLDKRAHIADVVLKATGIVTSLWLTVWGTKKSFEFEKEGTITTIMGRGFINKLIPKK